MTIKKKFTQSSFKNLILFIFLIFPHPPFHLTAEGANSLFHRPSISLQKTLQQLPLKDGLDSRTEIAKGKLACFKFASRLLKNKREIWVYTPAGYKQDNDYPLFIFFDGQAYVSSLIPTPDILDKLIAYRIIPSVVAVFVSSIDQASRNKELPCHAPFANFLALELLPWIKRHYAVTSKPSQVFLAGSSYGGLAAVYAAASYPDLFGNVLSQSGAFWWTPNKAQPKPWLIQQMAALPTLPVRFYLEAGDEETSPIDSGASLIETNWAMRDLLRSKGCRVYYRTFKGGHTYPCWKESLATGLAIVMEDF